MQLILGRPYRFGKIKPSLEGMTNILLFSLVNMIETVRYRRSTSSGTPPRSEGLQRSQRMFTPMPTLAQQRHAQK